MISEMTGTDGAPVAFIVEPNPPLPWSVLLRIYAGMAAFVLIVGTACAAAGLPLVPPFSGMEVVALGVGLYLSARRAAEREVIRVHALDVVFERGARRLERRVEFHRQWVRVVVQKAAGGSWYPSRLLLRSHGREAEAGSFLEEGERLKLARLLCFAPQQPRAGPANVPAIIEFEQCRGLEHGA
jgi:uncharacterized membrane protein